MGTTSKTVLICDDDQGMRDTITAILKRDYRVMAVSSGEAALTLMKQEDVDLILLDVRLPGISGFDVLRIVKENYGLVECIMISAINEVETAVQAMKHGAYHYITKNFEYDELRSLVRNAFERQDLNRQVITLSAQVTEQRDREFHIGPSKQIRDIIDVVQKVAKLSATVLILGESGTGKELLARVLHRESGRGEAPFIAVNLSAIPHELVESTLFGHERGAFTGAHKQQLGKFELAAGGTLFLDEIGDLRVDLQAKLLRAIQEGEIERVGGAKPIKTDFRLVVATNVDLDKAVKDGRFREDLYYRINVIPIRMPPLRERIDDLPELARLFVQRYKTKFKKPVRGVADSALRILASYWWPGNIRELENLIERLVAVSDKEWITDDDLPLEYHFAKLDSGPTTGEALFQEACDTFERNFVLRALEKCDWNVTATARYLGIPLSTLKHKMARLDLRDLARKLRGA
ncbi:MAG: sigma-54 dependent transcriptional regulator [Acidobacteria bacterium]|nr:sigma-54 dependent transcriptional regulator [Acidobacteriota bacterium]MCA1649038.1 sigma-54 dependent transcriptional regulator [Acidobacteriota bacterium]